MKKTLAFVVSAVAAVAVQAGTYEIDSAHTNARFAIDHFGTSTNTGGFYNLKGTVRYNPQKQTGSVDVRIPTASINTGNSAFDGHLKSADLFNVEAHPEMRFTSTRFHFKDGKPESVEGKLTLLGQTRPVTLKAERFNCYDNARLKAQVCGGDFTAMIDRTQWGMNYLKGIVTNEVRLSIQIEAVKK